MKKVAEYFALALLVLLGGVAVLTFLAPRFGWRTDAVMSGSMEPRLKVGGLAVTRPVEPEEIRVGDTILFHSPLDGKLTSHRVIAIPQTSSLHFRTKGDANEDADQFIVPAENVVGRVCLHIPYFGYVAQFVKSRLGLLLTLYLPGIIIIILEAIKIWRVLDEQELEKKRRGHSPLSDAQMACSVSQPSPTEAISPAIDGMLSPGQQHDVDRLVADIMKKVNREVVSGPGPGVKG